MEQLYHDSVTRHATSFAGFGTIAILDAVRRQYFEVLSAANKSTVDTRAQTPTGGCACHGCRKHNLAIYRHGASWASLVFAI